MRYCSLSKTDEKRLQQAARSNTNVKVSVNDFWSKLSFIRFDLISDS